jgi:hypothetical protein
MPPAPSWLCPACNMEVPSGNSHRCIPTSTSIPGGSSVTVPGPHGTPSAYSSQSNASLAQDIAQAIVDAAAVFADVVSMPGGAYSPPASVAVRSGCICPPGANLSCEARECPRKHEIIRFGTIQ